MTHSESLQELARQVRGFTIEVLQAAPPDRLTWTPPGTNNPILWHAGHAAWVVDRLCVAPLAGGGGELPEGWAARFGSGSRPAEVTQWPAREEVLTLLRTQSQRLTELLQAADPERLADFDTRLSHGWSLPAGIIHGLHDEARHHGEMYLLLKMCRG